MRAVQLIFRDHRQFNTQNLQYMLHAEHVAFIDAARIVARQQEMFFNRFFAIFCATRFRCQNTQNTGRVGQEETSGLVVMIASSAK